MVSMLQKVFILISFFYIFFFFWTSPLVINHAFGLLIVLCTLLALLKKPFSVKIEKKTLFLVLSLLLLCTASLVNYSSMKKEGYLQLMFFIITAGTYLLSEIFVFEKARVSPTFLRSCFSFAFLFWMLTSYIKWGGQMMTSQAKWTGFKWRYADIFGNPIIAASAYSIVGLYALANLKKIIIKNYRTYQAIIFFLLSFLIFTTKSRAPFVSFILCAFFILLRDVKIKIQLGWRIFPPLLVVLLIGLISLPRIMKGNENLRFAVYESCLYLIAERPIFGYGYRNSNLDSQRVRIDNNIQPTQLLENLHNSYLQLAVDGGILALVFFLLFLVSFFRKYWSSTSRISVMIFFLITSVLDSLIIVRAVYLIFFLLLTLDNLIMDKYDK